MLLCMLGIHKTFHSLMIISANFLFMAYNKWINMMFIFTDCDRINTRYFGTLCVSISL